MKKRQKRHSRRTSGAQFASLMETYGLRSKDGAELVARLLGLKLTTVYMAYQRGILHTEYQLLEAKLLLLNRHFGQTDDDLTLDLLMEALAIRAIRLEREVAP